MERYINVHLLPSKNGTPKPLLGDLDLTRRVLEPVRSRLVAD